MTTRFLSLTLFLSALAATCLAGDKLTVLHTFNATGTGNPQFRLAEDAAGNLYGTTFWGGNFHGCSGQGCGAVYRLSPNGSGYTYTVLYKFPGYRSGAEPTQLIIDASGNLYGELSVEGAHGCGSVFKLSPAASGPWTYTSIHEFACAPVDGTLPTGGLVMDSSGNLFGVTVYGGSPADANGTIFELSPQADGSYAETLLWSFRPETPVGYNPIAALTFDAAGNLFGVTADYVSDGGGGVFRASPGTSGWTVTRLHQFVASEGQIPQSSVTLDAAGNIYGATVAGGTNNLGAVYELSPASGGSYSFQSIYTFGPNNGPSYNPLTLDASGNLYGSAIGGINRTGMVFKLSPGSSGWTYSLSHLFTGGADGGYPNGLVLDPSGNLLGVANYFANPGCSNNSGCGIVFKLSPR